MKNLYRLIGKLAVPCADLREWATAIEDDNRQVALTDVGAALRVSTVFLGVDHGQRDGEPLLFETLVFADADAGGPVLYSERYTSWEEAEQGHWRAVLWAAAQRG